MSGILQTISQAFTAGVAVAWNVRAAHFRLLAGTAVDVTFFLNGAIVGKAEQVDSGFYLKSREVFDKVEILSAAGQTVKFTIGSAEAGAASAVSVSGTVNVSLLNGDYLQGALAVGLASAVVLAANPARRFLMLQNNHATGNVWVNLQGVAADTLTGFKLPPGDSMTLDVCPPKGAVQVIGDVAHSLLIVAHA